MEQLVELAREKGVYNIAFVCLFLLHRVKDCIELLCDIDRIPEASFMARTYLPRFCYPKENETRGKCFNQIRVLALQ